jgi:hypothetical protein
VSEASDPPEAVDGSCTPRRCNRSPWSGAKETASAAAARKECSRRRVLWDFEEHRAVVGGVQLSIDFVEAGELEVDIDGGWVVVDVLIAGFWDRYLRPGARGQSRSRAVRWPDCASICETEFSPRNQWVQRSCSTGMRTRPSSRPVDSNGLSGFERGSSFKSPTIADSSVWNALPGNRSRVIWITPWACRRRCASIRFRCAFFWASVLAFFGRRTSA